MVKKNLVPTDDLVHARKAIELATDIALRYDAKLCLLHVVTETEIPSEVLEYIRVDGGLNP